LFQIEAKPQQKGRKLLMKKKELKDKFRSFEEFSERTN